MGDLSVMKTGVRLCCFACVLLVLLLLPSGCPPKTPELWVSVGTLDFGTVETALDFRIENKGRETLQWECVSDAPAWLTLDPATGTNDQTITVRVDRSQLDDGQHNAVISIQSNGGSASINISVTTDCSAASRFHLSSSHIDFGNSATECPFTIYWYAEGTGPWDWTATGYASWVSVSPASGSGQSVVTVTVDRAQLATGDNTTAITIRSACQSETVQITARVDPPETVTLSAYYPAKAGVGDEVNVYGRHFSSIPSENVVSFNGAEAPATRYTPGTVYDPEELTVIVPEGATSGDLRVKVASSDTWSNAFNFTIISPTAITINAGWERDGVFVGPFGDTPRGLAQSWVLGGENLAALEAPWPEYTPNGLAVEVNGTVYTTGTIHEYTANVYAVPVNDTLLAIPYVPDEFFNTLDKTSGTLKIRIIGKEPGLPYLRYSNELELQLLEEPYIDHAYHSMDKSGLTLDGDAADSILEIPHGDWLYLHSVNNPDTQNLTCPELWKGVASFGKEGILERRFLMADQGSFTIQNLTTGKERTVVIKNSGVPRDYTLPIDTPQPTAGRQVFAFIETMEDACVLGSGGARLSIPAGALPLDEGRLGVSLEYFIQADDRQHFDTTIKDNNRYCRFYFYQPDNYDSDWTPPVLLKPVTLQVPFDPAEFASPAKIGCFDYSSHLYFELPSETDWDNHKLIFTFPAGTYPVVDEYEKTNAPAPLPTGMQVLASLAENKTTAPTLPPVTLHTISRNIGCYGYGSSYATMTDADGYFSLEYITEPTSRHYVSDAYASELLDCMIAAYDNLWGTGWREPDKPIAVYLRKWDVIGGYGSTTKAVFGRPYISINTGKCVQGSAAFYTTAAHEVAHVFQRKYTTNVVSKWFDEAAAEWVAFDTVGNNNFLKELLNYSLPFISTLPNGFTFGMSTDDAYAASPWAIWLHKESPFAVKDIYTLLDGNPAYWESAYSAFESVTGKTMSELYAAFAREYWMQTFDPIKTGVDLNQLIEDRSGASPVLFMNDYKGVSCPHKERPTMSSIRYTFALDSSFASQVTGRDLVLRMTGLGTPLVEAVVYSDTGPPASEPFDPQEIGVLDSTRSGIKLGTAAQNICYRVVFINTNTVTVPKLQATMLAPHITSLLPSSGNPQGGYTVTIEGSGFGTVPGTLSYSGNQISTQWSDTRVTFTMPNMGDYTGTWNLNLRTVEDAATNTVTFTFVK